MRINFFIRAWQNILEREMINPRPATVWAIARSGGTLVKAPQLIKLTAFKGNEFVLYFHSTPRFPKEARLQL